MEVVVVGGGLAGSAAALELRERGAAVNLVDRERAGAAATGASAGMLAPQYEFGEPAPLFELLRAARAHAGPFFRRLEDLSGESLHVRFNGMLVLNRTDRDHDEAERLVRRQVEAGEPAELLAPGTALELEPELPRDAVSYVWLPREGRVDAPTLVEALPRALAALDVRVITGRAVGAVEAAGGRVEGVRLADGRRLTADAVVVAAGAWSGTVEGLPGRVPVRPVRGQLLRYDPSPAGLGRAVGTRSGRYVVPRHDGTVLAGSTMEEVGFDRSITEEGFQAVHAGACELLPALRERRPLDRWADLRPLSPDGLPILGPDPEVSGLVYATGYGRNGILLSPLAGALVADLLDGTPPDHDLSPFGPDRFEAG